MGGLSIDHELWQTIQSCGVKSLTDKILNVNNQLGWKSHGVEIQLKELLEQIEFRINGKLIKDSIKATKNGYVIDYMTKKIDNSEFEYLSGFIVEQHLQHLGGMIESIIVLFPKIGIGMNSEGKPTIIFFDRSSDHLPFGYTVYRGYQNEVSAVCLHSNKKSNEQLIEETMLWLKNQYLSNLESLIVEKGSRKTIGTVISIDKSEKRSFDFGERKFSKIKFRLDLFPTWRYVKGGRFQFGHNAMGLSSKGNVQIPLKDLVEYYIFCQLKKEFPKIGSEKGKIVNVLSKGNTKKLNLYVGSDYLNYVKNRKGHSLYRFERLVSNKGFMSTLKEFILYLVLRDLYIKSSCQYFNLNRNDVSYHVKAVIENSFGEYKYIGDLDDSGVLQTLEEQGLISKSITSRNNEVITWVDISDDVVDSYKYWLSKIYINSALKTQRKRKALMQQAVVEGFAFEEINGKNIFFESIPKGYAPIPVENWEIYIINGDMVHPSILPQLLERTTKKTATNTLVSNITFKNNVKSFIKRYPTEIEIIKDNPYLNRAGLEASVENNMFKEGPPGLSKTMSDGFEVLDELYREYSNNQNVSILGNKFQGFKIKKSNKEAVVRNELFVSCDFKLININGKIVGNGIAKGMSQDNTLTRQTIEQLAVNGKRFVLFPELNDNAARVYVITFGAEKNKFPNIVKSSCSNVLYWEAIFHHLLETKIKQRYWSQFEKDPSSANFKVDIEIINIVNSKIIENKNNGYSDYIKQKWKKFIRELKTEFGEELLKTGISISKFNEWASSRYKSYLTWFS